MDPTSIRLPSTPCYSGHHDDGVFGGNRVRQRSQLLVEVHREQEAGPQSTVVAEKDAQVGEPPTGELKGFANCFAIDLEDALTASPGRQSSRNANYWQIGRAHV